MSLVATSKFIALVLRHKPEVAGITLDEHGWADVDALIEGVGKTHPLTRELLEEIVARDEKKRYSFNGDKTRIRANQGHSVSVDVELKEACPPSVLYHGTAEKYVPFIESEGLLPRSRLYVHLSRDYETAVKVGARHGKVVVYLVDTDAMQKEGYRFYFSENGVWLTDAVPPDFLLRMKE